MQFPRCYSNSDITNPSHISILLSQFLKNHRVYNNTDVYEGTDLSIADIFSKNGMDTCAVPSAKHLNRRYSGITGFSKRGTMWKASRAMLPTRSQNQSDGLMADKKIHGWYGFIFSIRTPHTLPLIPICVVIILNWTDDLKIIIGSKSHSIPNGKITWTAAKRNAGSPIFQVRHTRAKSISPARKSIDYCRF